MRKVRILDTTLRDGEQSPGAALEPNQKLLIAKQLSRLGVDAIEAGFPASSPKDFEAVSLIASEVKDPTIVSFARATQEDILAAWNAVKKAKKPLIHTFISTSDIHIKGKLGSTREKVLEKAIVGVKTAKSLCDQVEFTAEDSVRTDRDYLVEVYEAVIQAGATVINVADTVGYSTPFEMFELISYLRRRIKNIDHAAISIHCHNDLGIAVANTLAGIKAGASQVECTINGIGERAGNAALEEVVMALHIRPELWRASTSIVRKQLYSMSKMVKEATGLAIQANKAIVGNNAFAHEAGIHQHGVLKCPETYEIMKPEDVGVSGRRLPLGRKSGKHGLVSRLFNLGYNISENELTQVYQAFLQLADTKKEVNDSDLILLMKGFSPH